MEIDLRSAGMFCIAVPGAKGAVGVKAIGTGVNDTE